MPSFVSYRVQVLVAFVSSLYVGLRAARKDDGARSVRRTVTMNVIATFGILLGYRLASRSRERSE